MNYRLIIINNLFLQSHKNNSRRSILDTSESLDSKVVYRNAQIIAKTLVSHLYDYNISETPKIVST